jgi:hypothetical protein
LSNCSLNHRAPLARGSQPAGVAYCSVASRRTFLSVWRAGECMHAPPDNRCLDADYLVACKSRSIETIETTFSPLQQSFLHRTHDADGLNRFCFLLSPDLLESYQADVPDAPDRRGVQRCEDVFKI